MRAESELRFGDDARLLRSVGTADLRPRSRSRFRAVRSQVARPRHCTARTPMMRTLPFVVALLGVRPAYATETGIDGGWVVANGDVADPFGDVDSLGVGWVRINFRLDAWASPDDTTPHGADGLTWFQAYDRIVD